MFDFGAHVEWFVRADIAASYGERRAV